MPPESAGAAVDFALFRHADIASRLRDGKRLPRPRSPRVRLASARLRPAAAEASARLRRGRPRFMASQTATAPVMCLRRRCGPVRPGDCCAAGLANRARGGRWCERDPSGECRAPDRSPACDADLLGRRTMREVGGNRRGLNGRPSCLAFSNIEFREIQFRPALPLPPPTSEWTPRNQISSRRVPAGLPGPARRVSGNKRRRSSSAIAWQHRAAFGGHPRS